MPRIVQTNFTAGEISPKVYGRNDVERYLNGAASLENCIVNIHGGAERRPGTVAEAAAKYSDRKARLIPFVYSRKQAYVLEVGDYYLRIFRAGGGQILDGGVPYEVATPYSLAMLDAMDYTQGANTMFLFQESVFPQVLRRLADDLWSMQQAPFTTLPFEEVGHTLAAALTLSSASVGAGVTATADSGVFLGADVGRSITYGSGVATITALTDASTVTVEVTSAFPLTVLPSGEWVLEGSPQASLKPSEKGIVDQTVELQFDNSANPIYGPYVNINGLSWDGMTGLVTVTTTGSHGVAPGDTISVTLCQPPTYNGSYEVQDVPFGNTLTYQLGVNPGEAVNLGRLRVVSADVNTIEGWRAEDVGKFVRINRGLVKITEFVDANLVRGIVRTPLDSDVAAPADAWTLESSVWNDKAGYPRTGAFYEQRLVLAATTRDPQTMWGSRSRLFYDFTLGSADDDAWSFSLPSTGQINPIDQLVPSAVLVPLSYGGEYTMAGGVEKPIAPTNVQLKPRTVYGCSQVKPVRVGAEILFAQRAGRKIRALSYDPDTYRYAAPDLTVMSEHITESGIADMAYQQESRSLVWCALANGRAAVMALDRDEGVCAWTPGTTSGQYEAMASVPVEGGDEIWAVVARTVGGETRRFVERFVPGQYLDCAVDGHSDEGATIWAGLDHLEGREVGIRADGIYMGKKVVAGGQITLDDPAHDVSIGLMFSNRVKLMPPNAMSALGSIQAGRQSAHRVAILLDKTSGLKVNGDDIEFRNFDSSLLDNPPDIRSGYETLSMAGWYNGDAPVELVQDLPYPFHVLSVVRDVSANG